MTAHLGNLALIGNVANSGVIDAQDGAANDTITIFGDYFGAGQLLIDVDFAADVSDMLVVNGDVTGDATSVRITDISSGNASGNDVLVVDVTGDTSDGDFVLSGGAITASAYDYYLEQSGSQWLLNAVMNSTGDVYEAFADALSGFGKLSTLGQRVGQRQWLSYDDVRWTTQPSTGAWLRFHADRSSNTPESSTSGNQYDTDFYGIQVGYDIRRDASENGYWVFGLTGQYGDANTSLSSGTGAGSISSEGYGLGATATWYGDNNLYVDLLGQVSWINSDLSSTTSGMLVNGHSSAAYALSAEVGKRMELGANSAIIPQAQLTRTGLDGGTLTDSAENYVEFGASDSVIARLGLGYEYTGDVFFGNHAGGGHDEKLYVTGNLFHNFSGANDVNVAGDILSADVEATWVEIGAGGSFVWDGNKTFYTEASYRTALGSNDGQNEGFELNIGLKVKW